MAMRVPATDYEWGRPPAGVTEQEFDRRKDLLEGINGRDRMNTHFENTERGQVLAPRGDARGRPMPRDARFVSADNHGEWGNDKFMPPLEFGLDGPDSTHSYHGAGLPTRHDLSYPANRDHCGAMDALADEDGLKRMVAPSLHPTGANPKADGIDGDM
jgi:hypothetical protein